MCGIAGCVALEGNLAEYCPGLEEMTKALTHRGPDARGVWLSTHAALAHRRLIVLDPEGGSQPMVWRLGDRTCAVTYNGEIYNFRELRRDLDERGHVFKTRSDTEVLLHAYVEWGAECLCRLNGIFAFGLWDSQKQELLLARDRLGVKPLYYAERAGAVLFASEPKALLAHPLVAAAVDADGLAEIFSPAPIRTPGFAIYRDVQEVRPGYFVTFNSRGTAIHKYWSLCSEPHGDDLETTAGRVRDLMDDAVKRQLVADVPVVAMLSGGLDSSGLTAFAAREQQNQGKSLHTYAIDFGDGARNFRGDAVQPSLDAPWADRVSKFLQTQHHTITVGANELLDNFGVSTFARDGPGLGQLDTSLYLFCKALKQNATVALSGESADEIFGGYPWFDDPEALDSPCFPWMVTLGSPSAGEQASSWLSPDIKEKVRPQAYIKRRYEEALAEVPRMEGEDAISARRREIFYLNLTHWLSMLLDRKDRMSMAVGLEVRVPFCDHRLVEYVWNVPWEMKTVDHQEKGLLRRALTGLLPEDVRQRKKSAYPVSQDSAYVAGVRKWAFELLHDSNAAVLPFLNVPVMKAIAAGRIPAISARVAMVMLERIILIDTWLREYRVSVCS